MKKAYSPSQISVMKRRGTETWVYSYADLVTNLMALFVMIIILSSGSGKSKYDFIRGIETYVAGKAYATGRIGTGQSEIDKLTQIVSEAVQKSPLSGQISLSPSRTGVVMTFESAMVFSSGTAEVNAEAAQILETVASLAKKLPQEFFIVVEGHTDSRPVSSGVYPSNWELSSARAGGVVRFLQGAGFPKNRMRAVGLADTNPLEDIGDSIKNRRVVIRIDSGSIWRSH